LFDIDLSDTTANLGEAFREAIGRSSQQRNRMLGLAEWIPMLARTSSCKTLARLDQVVYELINRRRASAEARDDLLSMLLRAQARNDGGLISDRQVRDEVVTLFLAGQETTALSLSCAWYLLAQHPEVQARLEAEFALALGGRPPTVADLPRLRYTEMVVKETMRLYPPAYAVFRSVAEPFDIDGYRFEAGTMLIMPQWVVQRDPRWFNDPEAFRPSRWEGDLAKRIPRYAYFPFGGGSRQCLGKTFAATEVTLLLATIGQQFRFGTVAGESAAQLISRKQRSDHGLRMVLAERIGRG
jgi:cytochrome P450